MKTKVLGTLIQVFLSILTPELLKEFADTLLDFVETKVKGTASTIDDAVVLPLCKMVRQAFDLPE